MKSHVLVLAAATAMLGGTLMLLQIDAVQAEDGNVPPEIAKRLADSLQGIEPDQVEPAPMPGWYQISNGPSYGYMTEDGRYLIEGDLIDLEADTNLSEQQRQEDRKAIISALGEDEVITFAPEKPKHWVTVFTDVDCGYCRRLHQQIDEYNDKGIGVRYLFFPTAGPGSEAFKKAESVWCADDRRAALTAAKAGQPLTPGNCKNPIREQYMAARSVGARGTPAMVTEAGRLIGGYKPPAMLLQDLQSRP